MMVAIHKIYVYIPFVAADPIVDRHPHDATDGDATRAHGRLWAWLTARLDPPYLTPCPAPHAGQFLFALQCPHTYLSTFQHEHRHGPWNFEHSLVIDQETSHSHHVVDSERSVARLRVRSTR